MWRCTSPRNSKAGSNVKVAVAAIWPQLVPVTNLARPVVLRDRLQQPPQLQTAAPQAVRSRLRVPQMSALARLRAADRFYGWGGALFRIGMRFAFNPRRGIAGRKGVDRRDLDMIVAIDDGTGSAAPSFSLRHLRPFPVMTLGELWQRKPVPPPH